MPGTLLGSGVIIMYKHLDIVPTFLNPSVLPLSMLGDEADQGESIT